ncbi:protein pxr1-like [Pitangus sulphuratus]|nr:protein pxr1-like [Pitangus sulphuratus]
MPNSSWERRVCEKNNFADSNVDGEGGRGGAAAARGGILLQPVVKTMVRQAVSLKPMEVHSGAKIHLQPVEDPSLKQVDVPEGGSDLVGEPMLDQAPGRTCDPVEEPMLEQVFWQNL